MALRLSFKYLFRSLIIITALLLNIKRSSAQLTIYQGSQQTGTSATCVVRTIYSGTSIPSSLDNQITSIKLTKGFMATLAENADGSGNSYPFMAVTNDLNIDLNSSLDNKVSFIRVLPLQNTLKKGAGYKSPDATPNDNTVVDQLNVSWLYDWGPNDVSTSTREYALMAWGAGAANQTNVTNYIAKTDINHLLSFNEPDNSAQSNITVADAVPLHKNLEATGYRLGSPATEEQNAQTGRWLGNFMNLAESSNIRVDYVAIHWYDWGGWSGTIPGNVSPDPQNVFSRFKAYVNNIYNTYKKPIWITEFNANRNTTSATHVGFINLALPWLEAQPFIERYAYFFPPTLPPVDPISGNLTAVGTAYSNFNASSLAIKNNFDGAPDTLSLEAENATLAGITTTSNCTFSSGGKIVPGRTGSTQKVTFENIFSPYATNYKLRIYYYSINTAKNITYKINGGTANVVSLASTGSQFCFEGASARFQDITIPLTIGNNSIEFTETPILDRIQIIKLPPTTLPITLTNFSAEVKEYGVKLNWQTAQEVNNQYFELLKADDKKEFKVLAQIKGTGNSNSPKFYSFADFNPITGTNYYQLKQYDLDGKFETFNPIAVKFGLAEDNFSLLSTSASSVSVSISSATAKEGVISYLGIDGRILYKQNISVKSGLNTFNIPVDKSQGQIGIISFTAGGEQKTLKVSR
ncbi:glycosyl hydrolase [Pedobacter cryophilus]|uniref:Asl1-like glycosyl hydrolase catalytic domain-containing protein n=1 Tax=Pedobacter cryophilus TaxID=2571271 RepID=A0A4U1C232_9SPHI|nr:glycosyl hydrolase [Pedobacter cryophilus]TKB99074.1 hypothetical protein FA046_08160 [Pedobacter cryophilus]